MQKNPADISKLIYSYLEESLSPEQSSTLDAWLNENQQNRLFFNKIIQQEYIHQGMVNQLKIDQNEQALFDKVLAGINGKKEQKAVRTPTPRMAFYRHWWVAASVLFILISGAYVWLQRHQDQVAANNSNRFTTDISAGKDGAILTLADGSQIVLDSLKNGVVATQNGAAIVLKNGQLTYAPASIQTTAIAYNTITTPKGRQFQLTLPDGTRIWLNAASSIKYPTNFTEKERKITITGEAYLEVIKNTQQPFFVNINDLATVQVLGTSFNINAYENEPSINTTLIEGSVRVDDWIPEGALRRGYDRSFASAQDDKELREGKKPLANKSVILQPGEQAQIAEKIKVIKDANIEKVTSWRNNAFNFTATSFAEVMRQIERWYDIEVVYENGIPNIQLGGKASRTLSLSGILSVLSDLEVSFRLEAGRKLVISNSKI